MNDFNRKEHWEKVYATKELHEVSWYQPIPQTSLDFLEEAKLPKDARIIDVGGGDSFFVDHLLNAGYSDITVVDISENALERAKKRLGAKAGMVKWIAADATELELEGQFDFWHDRAVFHFLLQVRDIANYLCVLDSYIKKEGVLVLGTFSESGPEKCSGMEIRKYSEKSMAEVVSKSFEKVKCISVDHPTPFDTIQNFVFCSFKKLN